MENPFQVLAVRLTNIEGLLIDLKHPVQITDATPAEKIYTKPEAAKFLHITEQTLNGYVSANKIPFCKPTDGKVYFLHSDLINWLKRYRTATVDEVTETYVKQRSTRRNRATSTAKAV